MRKYLLFLVINIKAYIVYTQVDGLRSMDSGRRTEVDV